MNPPEAVRDDYRKDLDEATHTVLDLLCSGLYSIDEIVVFARRVYRRAWREERRRQRRNRSKP